MSQSKRFAPIQKIADKKQRDAAAEFGQTLREREAAQKRLQELQQYLHEYNERFRQASLNGIRAARVQEFQAFKQKLEQAIAEQQQLIEQAQHRCTRSKTEWQGTYTKAQAVENAVQRMRTDEIKQNDRREQQLSDERSQRRR